MAKLFAWSLIFALLLAGPAVAPVLAQDASGSSVNIEIVVDVSGSMAGVTDTQEMRMTAAQRVLNEVVEALPVSDRVNVGLRIYGHRGNNTEAGRAESCAASELVVPIAGVDKPALQGQINALVPTGWTPIGASIELATRDLQAIATPNSKNAIIVVTDGQETCGGDPVAAATAARQSDPPIDTHVIGFALAPEDKASIDAIAEAGGGKPINANNAGQLISALVVVFDELEVIDTGGDGSSREQQIGLGKIGRVGDYDVNVINVTKDATELVMSHNSFNDPPAEGKQFFIARVAVTYVGDTTGQPATDLDFQAVGDLNKGYAWYTDTCGDYPEAGFMVTTDLFPQGSAEFNVCWQIDSRDADSLVMYVSELLDFNEDPVWFNIGNAMPEAEQPVEATPAREDESDPTPSDTSDGDTDTTPEAPSGQTGGGDGSSRESAIPVGSTGEVGDYQIRVVEFTPDATEIIMSHNEFNEPPANGNQFAMVRLSVTYVGDSSGQPAADLDYQAVGDLNKGYAWYTDTCGNIPDEAFMVATDLFPQGTTEFNICWQIDSADADSLTMYVTDILDFNGDPVWFQLQPQD